METKLVQESTLQPVTAPGYSAYQVQVPEVQHHDNKNNDDNEKTEDESDEILPIDPGDVPQQKYLNVSFLIIIIIIKFTTHSSSFPLLSTSTKKQAW